MIVFAIRYAAIASEPAFDACLPEKTRSSTWSRWLLAMTDRDSRAAWRCSTDIFGHRPVRTREEHGRALRSGAARRTIAGYYTLSSTSVQLAELPEQTLRKLPKYPRVPATLMGRLAVDRRLQGKGYGRFLGVADALYRSARSEIASFALIVDAKDDSARRFGKRRCCPIDFLGSCGFSDVRFFRGTAMPLEGSEDERACEGRCGWWRRICRTD